MPVIDYQKLSSKLGSAGESQPATWLIHGEEFLRAQALEAILKVLFPGSSDRMNYEPVEFNDNQVVLALEKVNTYTFLPGPKVVAMLDCRLFDSPKNTAKLMDLIKAAVAEDNLSRAGSYFVRLLSALNLSLEDITGKGRGKLLKLDPSADGRWIDPVLDYCKKAGLSVPETTDPSQLLEEAIHQGFPENHHLIITTDLIDRRRRLYKVIVENGMVVDCSVPLGTRQAEKTAQEAVLKERMAAILKKNNKQIDPAAYRALYEKTGFQLRSFCGNLEKLIDYVGERNRIQADDVEAVLSRTRQDPVFELTGAVSDQDVEKALFYLKSMLAGELHPLQIIAALINQIRKLIIAREFIESVHGRVWRKGMTFVQFQRMVMPAVSDYDDELREMLSEWETMLGDAAVREKTRKSSSEKAKKKGKKKKTSGSGMFLAHGAGSPYPVFKLIESAHRFSLQALTDMLDALYEADRRLKTGEKDPELVLSDLILRICGKEKTEKK